MIRASLRIVIAAALVGVGWMAARAQTPEPDFEIVVDAPQDGTKVECVRGCSLAYVVLGTDSARTLASQKLEYACVMTPDARCSVTLSGWTKR